MSAYDQYYRVLGLEPGASLEAVNQAYKDLAFIWHPDRIPSDNIRLQQKAQEKLKEINTARDQLRSIPPSVQNKSAQPQPQPKPSQPRYQSSPPQTHYQSRSKSHHQARKPHPDLSGADFRGAMLKEKDFSEDV